MPQAGYSQFCPVAMAAEIICTRWTLLVLRELGAGTTRFNDLRRGVPRMSPALLSQRLKELEASGVVRRSVQVGGPGEYHLTEAGRELIPIVEAVGAWGQRWVDPEVSLTKLDAQLLMWDMRRSLDPLRAWWLVVCPRDGVDLCSTDPGHDVDLYVTVDLRTMTAIWMGADTIRRASDAGRLRLVGEPRLIEHMQAWLGLSPFARPQKLAS